MPKNILILTQKVDKEDDNLGFFHWWLEIFAKEASEVFVICNFLGEHALPQNVQIYSLGKERQCGKIRRYFNFYRYLFETLQQADAVFIHMIPAWVILVWPLAFIFRKKIYLWYTHKSVTFSLRLAEKLVEKIFTASAESCRLDSKKIILTGQGIDINRFASKNTFNNNNQLKLLGVGRIAESKNYKFLIEVAAALKKRGENFIFDIIGAPITAADFSYKNKLDDLINKKGLQNIVNFIGPKTYAEMPDVYNSHDLFIHASETGSLDKAVLEAMACGLPVLTTSEAFFGILAARNVVLQKDNNLMEEKIIELKDVGKDLTLRETVVKNHNLNDLIGKIIENL